MLPEAAGRGQHFQARGHIFSLYGPTLSRKITCLSLFSCGKLALIQAAFFKATLSLNWLYASSTNHSPQKTTSERVSIYQTKKGVLKNRFFSNYLMSVAFSSPVKLSKSDFFRCEISCKVRSCTTKTIYVSRCVSLEIRLFYRKMNGRQRGNSSSVFHSNSFKYSNDPRGKLDSN